MKNILIVSIILFQWFVIAWDAPSGNLNPIAGFSVYMTRYLKDQPEIVDQTWFKNVGVNTEYKQDLKTDTRHSVRVVPYSSSGAEGQPIIDIDNLKVRSGQQFKIIDWD
jgi:hypothetical protein